MSRIFINAIKNFREENGVVKFDLGEESAPQGNVRFETCIEVCLATDEFSGFAKYLMDQSMFLKDSNEESEASPPNSTNEPVDKTEPPGRRIKIT